MDVTAPAAAPPSPVQAADPATGETPAQRLARLGEENKDNFPKLRELAGIILDTTGAYSDDQKLEAWQTQFRMSVTLQFAGAGQEDRDLLNKIAKSDTYQQINAVRHQHMNAMMAAVKEADATGQSREAITGRKSLELYDSLSATDQKRMFASINAPDMTGATPYGSVDGWRTQMMSWAGLFAPIGDKLDLSADAKKVVGDLAAPASKPYAPGAKASLIA